MWINAIKYVCKYLFRQSVLAKSYGDSLKNPSQTEEGDSEFRRLGSKIRSGWTDKGTWKTT